MLSPRWLIGITLFLVFGFVLSNWVDGSPMMSSNQSQDIQGMGEHTTVTVTNPSGGITNYVNIAVNALTLIGKALSWDYSFLHDINPITGLEQNSDLSMFLFVVRMAMLAISVGIIFQIAYLLRQIVVG